MGMTNQPKLRQRKKLKTRQDLAEAAYALFGKRGFDNVTVAEIAQAADVSRRTFFRYFPSKESVVFPHRMDLIARFRRLIDERDKKENPLRRCRYATLIIAKEYMGDRDRILRQHHIVKSSTGLIAYEYKLDLILEESIAEALTPSRKAKAAQRRRARLIAGVVIGVIRAALREWFAKDARTNLVRLAEKAFDLLDSGLE